MEKINRIIPVIREGELWSPLQAYQEKSVMEAIGKPLGLKTGINADEAWAQAAEILSVYDNPRFETARYLIVRDGRITEHIAVSSQIPAATNVYPHTWMLNRLRKQLGETDSAVLFSHNHPSGIVLPSQNDIEVTKYLAQYFIDDNGRSRFLGHIITGTSGASYADSEGKNWLGLYGGRSVPLDTFPQRPANIHSLNIQGDLGFSKLQLYIEEISKKSGIDTTRNVFACYSDTAGFITGIKTIPQVFFWKNQVLITEDINASAKKAGAASVYLVVCKHDRELFAQVEGYAKKSRKVAGAVMPPSTTLRVEYCSERIFHEKETVPLKVEDSRTMRRRMAMQNQPSPEYEFER